MAVTLSSLLLDADLFLISPRQLASPPIAKISFYSKWNIFLYNAGEDTGRRSYEELLMSIWLLSNSIKTLRVNWHPCQMIKQVSM
ncbi:hypothetical protein ACR78Q_13965, partial [Sphingobacterium spiritivorum]|uniref:hypothetical protein n=2 Tax=Sphingobacterium spiritivorum TaxID=258 RepID=UPI003DA36D86